MSATPDTLPATLGDPTPTTVPPSERADMIGHAREIAVSMAHARARGGYGNHDGSIMSQPVQYVDLLPHEAAMHEAACRFLAREFNRGYRDSHEAPKVEPSTSEPSKAIVP